MAVNGCTDQSPSPHTVETDGDPALMSTTSDSQRPSLISQQKVNSCDESQEEEEDNVGTRVAEACIGDVLHLGSGDQEHILPPVSSCDPPKLFVVNGFDENTAGKTSVNVADVETTNLQGMSANSSIHISAAAAADNVFLDSHDDTHPVTVCRPSHSSLLGSVTMVQAAGMPVVDSASYKSLKDCEEVHGQLVSSSEHVSAASMPRLCPDRHSVSSISSDTCASSINLGARTGSDILPNISMSHSSEKLWSWPNRRERAGFDSQAVNVVRSSWSQENYFDDSDVTCIDIDLDDDDLASSIDVLHYRDPAMPGDTAAHCWMEDDIRHGDSLSIGKLRSWAPLKGDEVFSELFSSDSESSLDEDYSFASTRPSASDYRQKAAKTYGVGVAIDFDPSEVSSDTEVPSSSLSNSPRLTNWSVSDSSTNSRGDNFDDICDDVISVPLTVFSDIATRPSSKDVDRPSAARLAKRLYYLQGFRKADVSRHLTKKYAVYPRCIQHCFHWLLVQSSFVYFILIFLFI